MSKPDKKKTRLQERINELETLVKTSLGKKDSRTAEINLPKVMGEIANLKAQLGKL